MNVSPIKILIVEDSITQAAELQFILEQHQFVVKHEMNGNDALEGLKEFKPDIIISDIVMPGLDGYEFASIVKSNETLKSIPIILLTALSKPEDLMKGLESGADCFLVKPYHENVLIERIQYFIENEELKSQQPKNDTNLDVYVNQQQFHINASPRQILDVLLSTYEHALLTNQELIESNKKLEEAQGKVSGMNAILEQKVSERTNELAATNDQLKAEIAERLIAEKTLNRQYFTLNGIIESVGSPIFSLDTAYRYTSFNEVHKGIMQSLYGVSIDVGHNMLEYMTVEEDRAIAKQNLDLVMAGKSITEEAYSGDSGYARRYFEVSHSPIFDDEKKVIGVAVMASDITDRKKAEQKLLERKQYLKELNATKDKFFSIISHDLKNPFNSILGFSNLLIDQIQQQNFSGIEKYAHSIHDTAQHTMSLLLNLLEWANSQTGKLKFHPERIPIELLFQEVLLLLQPLANEKSIEITTEIPTNCQVFADKAMISTVLRNLICNAIKYTNYQGKINLLIIQNEDGLKITIADNGIGIDPHKMKDLFRIDKNSSTPGTHNEKGSGLGLHLCQEFIKKHNGKIWAESEQGVGTSFHFTIPNLEQKA